MTNRSVKYIECYKNKIFGTQVLKFQFLVFEPRK